MEIKRKSKAPKEPPIKKYDYVSSMLDDNQKLVLEWLKNGTATAPFSAVFNLVTKRESEWHDLSDVSMASYELDRKKQAEVLLVLAQSILKQEVG